MEKARLGMRTTTTTKPNARAYLLQYGRLVHQQRSLPLYGGYSYTTSC